MISIKKCPRCGNTKSWRVRRGKKRCSACRYEWRESGLPLHLSVAEWKKLLRWFLLGLSSEVIAREAKSGQGAGASCSDPGKRSDGARYTAGV